MTKSPAPARLTGGLQAGLQLAGRAPSPAGVVTSLRDHAVADRAQVLDRDLDDVSGQEPDRRLAGEAHAAGRAGGDHVTRDQAGKGGEELDRAGNVNDHL